MQPEIPNSAEQLYCYLPQRSSPANSLDDLIQTLTESLIERLDDIFGSEILDRLAGIPDPELQQETMLLREEIQRLKDRLNQI